MVMRWVQRLQPYLMAVSLVLIVLLLRNQWTELRSYPWRLHGGWLALSGLLMAATWGVEVNLWRWLLAAAGGSLPFAAAWRIWFYTALVRYLPGNIWQPLSMTVYCQGRGIRPEATLMSMMLYQIVALLAVAPLAVGYWLTVGDRMLLGNLVDNLTLPLVGLILVPVVVILLRPDWLVGLVNWALSKIGRDQLAMQITTPTLVVAFLLGVASWLLWGVSFAALTFALRPYDQGEWLQLAPALITVFAVGYIIGFLSLITPSGFGVREGAYLVLLTPLMDGATVAVAALAMRLWIILGELAMAGVSALTGKRSAPEPAGPPYAEGYATAYGTPAATASETQLE
jgi:glycosyltransferase 2 family protein